MRWLEILGLVAVAALVWRWIVWRPALFRFAYVHLTGEILPNGEDRQQLKTADVYRRPVLANRRVLFEFANDVATLFDNRTNPAPENVQSIAVSPAGSSLLALSAEVPIGALDNNVRVWRMADGALRARFNEHTLAGLINRANCEAPEFEAFLDSERAAGVPEAVLAGYGFTLLVDGADGNAQMPTLVEWIDEDRLNLRWRFQARTSTGVPLTLNLGFHVRILVAPGIAVELPAPFAAPPPRPGRITLAPVGTVLHGGGAIDFLPEAAPRTASRAAD